MRRPLLLSILFFLREGAYLPNLLKNNKIQKESYTGGKEWKATSIACCSTGCKNNATGWQKWKGLADDDSKKNTCIAFLPYQAEKSKARAIPGDGQHLANVVMLDAEIDLTTNQCLYTVIFISINISA